MSLTIPGPFLCLEDPLIFFYPEALWWRKALGREKGREVQKYLLVLWAKHTFPELYTVPEVCAGIHNGEVFGVVWNVKLREVTGILFKSIRFWLFVTINESISYWESVAYIFLLEAH